MRRALSALVWIAACAPSPERSAILPEIPAEITRVAAIALDADDSFLRATGLQIRSPSIALPSDLGSAEKLVILGFTEQDLAGTPLASSEVLASSPLVPYDGARPLLPLASFSAEAAAVDDVFKLTAGDRYLRLSAPWLAECPRVLEAPSSMVDISCAPLFCGATATQRGCDYLIDTAACALGEIEASLEANGGAQIRAPSSLCVSQPAPAEGLVSLRCDEGCNITVYPPPGAVKIAALKERVIEVEPRFEAEFHTPVVGYIGGLAVLADRVIVFTHDGGWADDCLSRDHGRAVVIDPETLEERTSFEAPPCVAAAAADPRGSGYFALYGRGELFAGRFTADGVLISERRVPLPDPIDQYRWTSLVVHREEDAITALAMHRQNQEINAHSYTLVGPDLALRAQSPAVSSRSRTAVELEPGRVALGDQSNDQLHVIDTISGAEVDLIDLQEKCGHANPEQLYYDLVRDRLVVTSVRDVPGINVIDEGVCKPASFFERDADTYGVASWAVEPLLLIGATDRTGARAHHVALLDPETPRLLRGTLEVGRGPAIDFTRDARGRVWMTFPWTGEVARVEAIDPLEGP